ncbi:hypothetical protein AD948_08160 [Acetobacter senegalensis]|uniref:Uncharacterized protein n=1 Tax=Acetobacter senegalensis TaxID=446692 RepID=A0A149U2N8_9PROT|nr:hypothetical protein AD948_08160 [Acetobacter senegalensis]
MSKHTVISQIQQQIFSPIFLTPLTKPPFFLPLTVFRYQAQITITGLTAQLLKNLSRKSKSPLTLKKRHQSSQLKSSATEAAVVVIQEEWEVA